MNCSDKQLALIRPSIVWGGDEEKGLIVLPDGEGIYEAGFLPVSYTSAYQEATSALAQTL